MNDEKRFSVSFHSYIFVAAFKSVGPLIHRASRLQKKRREEPVSINFHFALRVETIKFVVGKIAQVKSEGRRKSSQAKAAGKSISCDSP